MNDNKFSIDFNEVVDFEEKDTVRQPKRKYNIKKKCPVKTIIKPENIDFTISFD